MRVALIDDEQSSLDMISEYLNRFAEEQKASVSITYFHTGDEILEAYRPMYDMLIFDISMPGINGLDAAREIRKRDKFVSIIFVTSLAQYAICGYEVDAIDYVLKPVTYPDFAMKMKKALARMVRRADSVVALDTQDGIRRVKISEISYVEVLAHVLDYHCGKRVFKVRGSMKDVESSLIPYGFVRIYKCYLVNLSHVREVRAAEVLVDDVSLPLGRAYKKEFMQGFMRYIEGE